MSEPGGTILLVEDDIDTRDMMSRLLTAEGYSVKVAANGWEALLVLEQSVDLIILDMMLPGMDGFVFLRSLRHMQHGTKVPVVVVTALDVAEVRKKAEEYGVREIISKGDNIIPKLKSIIPKYIRKPRPHARVTLPQDGTVLRPYLDVYLKMLAWT